MIIDAIYGTALLCVGLTLLHIALLAISDWMDR
jgi:hypothetical protein